MSLTVRIECHCKDCIHWQDMCKECTDYAKLCTIGGYMVGENGYCVYGEKRPDADEERKKKASLPMTPEMQYEWDIIHENAQKIKATRSRPKKPREVASAGRTFKE